MIFEPNSDIKAIVKKASLYRNVSQDSIDLFKKEIKTYFEFLNDHQTEETQKGFLKTFLEHTYYKEKYLIVGDENRKDLAILGAYDTLAKTNVFIETKSTTSDEMVKKDDLRAKAFYETILYYMNDRHNRNDELKHIIITNMKEWCIIDALDYDRIFWRDNSFKKKYEQFINGQLSFKTTDQFYEYVAAPFVEESKSTLRYTYFNLRDLTIDKDGKAKSKVSDVYKILSPNFLFKQYERDDNNHLNRKFYTELLYIMGLEETEEDNKRLIKRKEDKKEGALIENTIEQIKSLPISYIPVEGDTEEDRIFNAALQLSIVWINRLLFLKLLEAQLLVYNNNDESFKFLNSDNLRSYSDLEIRYRRLDRTD